MLVSDVLHTRFFNVFYFVFNARRERYVGKVYVLRYTWLHHMLYTRR